MSNIPDAQDTREHTVYRCYNAADELLYVGCTRDLDYRLSLHNPIVIRETRRISTETYPNRVTGRAAERAAIEAEGPLLNKQHNPARFTRKPKGGFQAVEPVHSLTAELVKQSEPVTVEELREAMQKYAAFLDAS